MEIKQVCRNRVDLPAKGTMFEAQCEIDNMKLARKQHFVVYSPPIFGPLKRRTRDESASLSSLPKRRSFGTKSGESTPGCLPWIILRTGSESGGHSTILGREYPGFWAVFAKEPRASNMAVAVDAATHQALCSSNLAKMSCIPFALRSA